MLVCVTGGSGFVGSHSAAAAVRAGARVRMLVRDPAAALRALAPLGVDQDRVEFVTGDVTDESSVDKAVRGCDAVLHAAAVYSFDARSRGNMLRTNARATDLVLGAGRRFGADPIVHVSSIVAMYPAPQRVLRADSPVGHAREAYMASKAAAEAIARRHQDEGAPVVISYPPALLGPHDPHLGDQTARLRNTLRGLMPMWPTGGYPVGDVRDTAALHAELLARPADAGGRFFGPGRYLTTRRLLQTVRDVTGRSLPAVFLPARAMLPAGLFTSAAQRVWPWHIPAEYGAIYVCACGTRVGDDADTGGIAPRPAEETVADAVRWLYAAGHVSARLAGAAAAPVSAPIGAYDGDRL